MKLNKTETAAFNEIGAAICASDDAKKIKKQNMQLVAAALIENRGEFIEGVTIGDYRFKIVTRDELTAMRV